MSGDHNANQDYDKKINAAAEHLGAGALKMIKAILLKHDAAIIEASQEAIEAAVAAEREAIMEICNRHNDPIAGVIHHAIRARGSV